MDMVIFLNFVKFIFYVIMVLTYCIKCSDVTQSMRSTTDCPRIRKAWHLLSTLEKQTVTDAMLEFRQTSDFETIASIHSAPYISIMHQSSANFLWHEYLLWEVESRIRIMNQTKYGCFAMPYYDFTIDFGKELNPSILSEPKYFGGYGDPNNLFAVNQYSWKGVSNEKWSVPKENACIAKGDIWPNQCSIKRIPVNHNMVGHIVDSPEKIKLLLSSDKFKNFEDMHKEMGWKNYALNMFSGIGRNPDKIMIGDQKIKLKDLATVHIAQPYEPIWWLHHSFARYQLSMWTFCHGYDVIGTEDMENHPEMYTNYCGKEKANKRFSAGCIDYVNNLSNTNKKKEAFLEYSFDFSLDAPLDFHPLNEQEWSYVYHHNVTIRELYDISLWNIKYEAGTFWKISGIDTVCKNKLNQDWFILELNNNVLNADQANYKNGIIAFYLIFGIITFVIISYIGFLRAKSLRNDDDKYLPINNDPKV